MTIAGIYNDFTVNRIKLNNAERTDRMKRFLEWFGKNAKKNCALLGDFNINWSSSSPDQEMLWEWSQQEDLHQVVQSSTRFYVWKGEKRQSMIDLAFIRDRKTVVNVFDPLISDHCAVTVGVSRPKTKSRVLTVKKTTINSSILDQARNTKLTFTDNTDFDEAVQDLTKWCQNLKSLATTEIQIKTREKSFEINDKIRNLRTIAKLLPNSSTEYKKVRNKLQTEIRKAKNRSGNNLLSQGRSVWSLINGKPKSEPIELLLPDGKLTKDRKEVATLLANHFQSKVNRLKREPDTQKISEAMFDHYGDCEPWDLKEVSFAEVGKIIDALPSKTSTGSDGISYRFVKQFKFELVQPLTWLINKSIVCGTFPPQWKRAKITPIWKSKGKRSSAESYRPIGLTSSFGKIVEMAIRSQIQTNLEEKGLLPDGMHGFH